MPIDFDAQLKLQDLRLRILTNPDYRPTGAEMREVLLDLQRGREAAAAIARRTRSKSTPRTAPPAIDLDALFEATHE